MTPREQLEAWQEQTSTLSTTIGRREAPDEARDWLDLIDAVAAHDLTDLAVVTDLKRSAAAGSISAKRFDAAVGRKVLHRLANDLCHQIGEVKAGRRTPNLVFPTDFYQRAAHFLNQMFLEIDDLLDKAPRLFSDEVFEILFDE